MAPADDSFGMALELPDAAATHALGARLAALLRLGEAALLFGRLGAGKTTLARGFVAGWTGADQDVPSPTYTLVQRYEGPKGALAHFDLYRVEGPDELDELGLEDALEEGACVIEWPERLGGRAPADRVEVRLEPRGEARRARVSALGRLKERWHEF